MDITQLLNSTLGKQVINGIGKQAGTGEKDTASVINASIPVIMGMLQKNASTPQGSDNLMKALDQHDGGILNNLSSFLNSGDTQDGSNILDHILGQNKNTVIKSISKQTNVSSANVSKIISLVAPVIMGYLGQQKKGGKVQSGNGLTDLLGSLTGGSSASSIGGSILSTILNQKGGNTGNMLNDILGSVTGGEKGKGNTKGGGLGDVLGNLFGKK